MAATMASAQTRLYLYVDSAKTVIPSEWNRDNLYSHYRLSMEMPEVDGMLRHGIMTWANNNLSFENLIISDVDLLLQTAIEDFKRNDIQEHKDAGSELSMPYEYNVEMKVSRVTDKYISMSHDNYIYLGGAHGVGIVDGAIFRCKDGKIMEWDDLFVNKEALRPLLTSTFNKMDRDARPDWDLVFEYTNSDINNYPMPATDPWINSDGKMVFIYQSYEIGPYAMGMPQCEIPISRLLPYMKPEAKKLFSGGN